MKEKRVLMRDWVDSSPDGSSVRRAEYAFVEIDWPEPGEPKGNVEGSYSMCGDWRLLPRITPDNRDAFGL